MSTSRSLTRSRLAASALLALAACRFDAVPLDGARITCDGNADCPPRWSCNLTTRVCVPSDRTDSLSPMLVGAAEVDPPVGRAESVFTVRFQVSEPLLSEPVVTFVNRGQVRALTLIDGEPGDQPRYRFRYAAQGDEAEAESLLQAVLVDRAGNTTQTDLGASLAFDFTRPRLLEGSGDLQLVPANEYPLRSVSSARVGTTLRLSFGTTEPLAALPTVRGVSETGSAPMVFAAEQASVTSFRFSYQVPSEEPPADGLYALEVDLLDLAGNSQTETVLVGDPALPLTVVVDATVPSAPDVFQAYPGTDARIVYDRIPWGCAATSGAPLFALRGANGAVEPGATVVAFTGAEGQAAQEIARADATPLGSFGAAPGAGGVFSLGTNDRPEVFVAAVDGAGNMSRPVRVRDVAWVATLGGKETGSSSANPHAFEFRNRESHSLILPVPNHVGIASGVAEPGGERLRTSGAGTWERYDFPTQVSVNASSGSVAYDPRRGVAIHFGGEDCSCSGNGTAGPCNRIWERRGPGWFPKVARDPELDGDPVPRHHGAMVYDTRSEGALLFGGDASTTYGGNLEQPLADTWLWDGRSWRRLCTEPTCAGLAPTARSRHAMVCDERRRRAVLFGGSSGGDETWEWDGQRWEQRCTASPCKDTRPSARTGHAMAWDPLSNSVLLFGGSSGASETWRWDGERWSRLCAEPACAATLPEGRSDHAMVFDPARKGVLLFGGRPASPLGKTCSEALGDTWLWSGEAWSAIAPADPEGDGSPQRMSGHVLYYDAERSAVVLTGGRLTDDRPITDCYHLECVLADSSLGTWEWRGAGWRLFDQTPTGMNAPARPLNVSMSYDRTDRALRAFVTCAPPGCAGVYRWSGAVWKPEQLSPAVREAHASAFSDEAGQTVLLGFDPGTGRNETWVRTSSGWAQRCTGTCASPPHPSLAMAYSAANQRVVAFSSDSFDAAGLWAWDGSAWSLLCDSQSCPSPAPRMEPAMASVAQGPTYLFGGWAGHQVVNDLWEWTGSAWVERGAPGAPGAPARRHRSALAYDPGRARLLLHGGRNWIGFGGNCNEGTQELCRWLWEWDAQTGAWSRPPVADPEDDGEPGPMDGHALAQDPSTGETLLLGEGRTTYAPETWRWDGGAKSRPQHLFSVSFAAARAPQASLLAYEIHWVAGGGGDAPGAALSLWSPGGWKQVAVNDAAAAAPAPLTWSSRAEATPAVGEDLSRHLAGPLDTLTVAATPLAHTGTAASYSELATDYAEVRVRYRLP